MVGASNDSKDVAHGYTMEFSGICAVCPDNFGDVGWCKLEVLHNAVTGNVRGRWASAFTVVGVQADWEGNLGGGILQLSMSGEA